MAFVELGLNRVGLAVRADNRRALRLYARRSLSRRGSSSPSNASERNSHDMVLRSMLRYLRGSGARGTDAPLGKSPPQRVVDGFERKLPPQAGPAAA